MEFKYNFPHQFAQAVACRMLFYLFVRHRYRATQRVFVFPVRRSLFSKLLGTRFSSIQEPFNHCHSVLNFHFAAQKM